MSLLGFGRSDPRWLVLILALSALGAVVLALAAWFLLPLLAFGGWQPFEDPAARLGVILVIVLLWGGLNALLRAQQNSADQARLNALERQELEARVKVDAVRDAHEAAFAEIRAGARRAFRRLRGRSLIDRLLGRGQSLPRYLVIGPPGSGKTSALAGADLTLPFDLREAEADATSACRFLVSDEAVFVDVAGALSTPDPSTAGLPASETRPAWTGLWPRLLDLLRTARPAQPVNGVLLVVSATDLAALDEEPRADLARALRTRLDEVAHRLRIRVPVYILLTKLDRLPGFTEFFEPLGAAERNQIWGVALPALDAMSAKAAHGHFAQDFDDLVRRVATRQLSFLHAEPDERRRILAYEFPAQLAGLRDVLADFLDGLARANRFDEPPLLRGLFLSSAVQDGARSDALGPPLARGFGFPELASTEPASDARGHRRAYFLKRVLGEVILSEAGSSGLSARARIGLRLRTHAMRAAAAAILTAGALLLWSAYRQSGFYVGTVLAAADRSGASLAELAPKSADARSPERRAFAPTLAALDDLAGLDAAADAPLPEGFDEARPIRAATETAYRDGLTQLLLPPLMRALEARIADSTGAASVRFQSLKLYLLLGSGRPPSAGLMADLGPILAADWLERDAEATAVQHVVGHLAAFASVPLPAQTIDAGLVATARRGLAGVSVAQIGYELLRRQPAMLTLRPWRPVDHAGSLGPRAIARLSGAALSDGVLGLFTASGLSEAVATGGRVAEGLSADAWVFGEATDQPNLTVRALQAGILDLYRAEYVRGWEALLSDLTVPPMPTAGAGAELIAILNGPTSPIVQLLTAVVSETSLDREVGDGLVQGIKLQAGASPVAGAVLARPSVAALMSGPRQAIARQFAPLREAVTRPKEGQDSDVDAVLKGLDPLYRQLLLVAAGAPQPETAPTGAGAALMQAAINRLPVAIRTYFTRLASETAALVKWDIRGRAAQSWAATVRPTCEATVAKAFPFDLKAGREVPLGEFTRLFSPNGLIANFRRTQLASLIDTSSQPWRWRDGRAQPSDAPDPTLAMFERAEAITTAFFAEGDRPAVRFTLETVRLDPKAERLQFDTGGASLVYAHGPETAFTGQWPPPVANAPATLSLSPEIDGAANALIGEGQWGLFRLVAQARVAPGPDAMLLAFNVGRREARLRLATPTLKNPFDLRRMAEFRCPEF